jgi:tRNA pseudouridine synthase 10
MVKPVEQNAILSNAKQMLSEHPLCDSCLGRHFGQADDKLSNSQRGKHIKKQLKWSKKITSTSCWLCEGLLTEIPHFIELITKKLEDYEFDTFVIGSKIDEDILEREHYLMDTIGNNDTESIKAEVNREIGLWLEKHLHRTVDFLHPTIMVILDTVYDDIHLQIQPLYIYGRYNKYERGIPQTRWFCSICAGKGCKRCKYTGTQYPTSIEQLIGHEIVRVTQGTGAILHGCGREDIDVRMLGNGRPFIIEISDPKKRSIGIPSLQKQINKHGNKKIEVLDLRFSDKTEVIRIKQEKFNKIYRVVFIGETDFAKEKLKEAARLLQGTTIVQYTPTRVAHRRAHLSRKKKIYTCTLESIEGTRAIMTIEAGSGTYIKELITGDDGKTRPSISELIGIPCTVKELDVIEIKGE